MTALNVVTIAELREEGQADRAAWKRESGEARSEREKFAREIARLTREGRHGTRRCRLTLEEVENGTRCPPVTTNHRGSTKNPWGQLARPASAV